MRVELHNKQGVRHVFRNVDDKRPQDFASTKSSFFPEQKLELDASSLKV